MTVVLDASALLAVLFDEPGGAAATEYFGRAIVCATNVTEVVTKLIDKGRGADKAIAICASLPVSVVPLDGMLALRAGALREVTHRLGLSLGDRTCLALAEREGVPAVTADRRWANLSLRVEVVLLR